jgi:hypothetical protein
LTAETVQQTLTTAINGTGTVTVNVQTNANGQPNTNGTISFGTLNAQGELLVLNLPSNGHATSSGDLTVAGLIVNLPGDAAANGGTSLFGTVKLVSGQGAAGVSHITPGPNEFYQINNCPIQSINCIVLPVQPLPTLLPVNTLFFEVPLLPTDDPDLIDIMPNVWKRDY